MSKAIEKAHRAIVDAALAAKMTHEETEALLHFHDELRKILEGAQHGILQTYAALGGVLAVPQWYDVEKITEQLHQEAQFQRQGWRAILTATKQGDLAPLLAIKQQMQEAETKH